MPRRPRKAESGNEGQINISRGNTVFLKKKLAPVIGLDISSTAVKLLELSKNGHRFKVECYAVEPLPPNSVVEKSISDAEAVGQALKRALKRAGSRGRYAAVAVSGSSVITKVITMPGGLSAEEMEEQIRAERPARRTISKRRPNSRARWCASTACLSWGR